MWICVDVINKRLLELAVAVVVAAVVAGCADIMDRLAATTDTDEDGDGAVADAVDDVIVYGVVCTRIWPAMVGF